MVADAPVKIIHFITLQSSSFAASQLLKISGPDCSC
jgi:hypothetical protein